MAIEFRKAHTLGYPRQWAVLKAGIVLGHIRGNAVDGQFRYYHGPTNQLTSSIQADSLEEIQQQIIAHHEK